MANPPHIVVASTRRHWSGAEKQAILAEAADPATTISAVARKHGLHSSLLFRWRRLAEQSKGRRAGSSSSVIGNPPSFIPVALPAPLAPARAGVIEIELAGGHRIRAEGPCDPDALRGAIAALLGR